MEVRIGRTTPGVTFGVLVLMLGLLLMDAWALPRSDVLESSHARRDVIPSDDVILPDNVDRELLELLGEQLGEGGEEEAASALDLGGASLNTPTPSTGRGVALKGLRACFKLRLLRVLLRLLLVQASGFNIKQLQQEDTTTGGAGGGGGAHVGETSVINDTETDELCDFLCNVVGACPPGCPADSGPQPPWGRRR